MSLEIPAETQSEDQQAADTETERHHGRENALLVRRTIRSGQTVRCTGHVTVLGDVNPGGQVVAGGDIVIWGKLRGTVHAGATGDDHALVCALVLAPTQLRIGSHIARSPEEEVKDLVIPEMARVQENGIVVEPWSMATL